MNSGIAIVGLACCYPDARSPDELWKNVLAQRRAFRRIPDERLSLADYFSADRDSPDSLYSTNAAVIEGYEFDRLRFRVAGETLRAVDPIHWLALDTANQALEDAGYTDAVGLPRQNTGVLVGNTLTAEFSRAATIRLRWPYVRRRIAALLTEENWSNERRYSFLKQLEDTFKEPFPPISAESLAGGLSNTIAGRICNYFDFKGGGYTIDGACSSSLLAIANACSALSTGDLDAALVGGADLSLDPFELIGFAKAGALASDEMRVYDDRSNGFWPGEGCGFVLLMRHEDALAQKRRVYALIRGWGISSDGKGGLTRPEIDGQLLALTRAYKRAGFGADTIAYFEGHGTGTSVGDRVEVQALIRACQRAASQFTPAAIGSIKANIGHTKAAAGIAGIIKTVMALNAGIIPPATSCEHPRAELGGDPPFLRTPRIAEPWPADRGLRAGVSSMGFGGINVHVVLEAEKQPERSLSLRERELISSSQDAELFLFTAVNKDALKKKVDRLLKIADRLSRAELSDVATTLAYEAHQEEVRAAVVARTPLDLFHQLEKLATFIQSGETRIDASPGIFFGGRPRREPRIGFLFPGQGSPSHTDGGALRRRFHFVQKIYDSAEVEDNRSNSHTLTAQPAIVTASMATLAVLDQLNVTARIAVGHSLGELTAYYWAQAISGDTLLRIAKVRGAIMTRTSRDPGAMASIAGSAEEVRALLNGEGACIGCLNSPRQTVVSGSAEAIDRILLRASERGFSAAKLLVSHAFHSPEMIPVVPLLSAHFSNEEFNVLQRIVISTITGDRLRPQTNLPELLCKQLTSPVRFMDAVHRAATEDIDLWLEVGPGRVLQGIMDEITHTSVIALDAGGESLRGVLCAAAAAFVLGQPIKHQALFAGRFTKPFNLDWHPKFFVNPCELAPVAEPVTQTKSIATASVEEQDDSKPDRIELSTPSILELVTELVADRSELPVATVSPHSRLLSDLHLNSITVGQLIGEAARRLGLPRPVSPTDFADARVSEIAEAFDEQAKFGRANVAIDVAEIPSSIDSWVKAFNVELVEQVRPYNRSHSADDTGGRWKVLGSSGDQFAELLRQKFSLPETGGGVAVCLPPGPDETVIAQLLSAARLALSEKNPRFLLVQRGFSAAAFARTLHLEAPNVVTCVVNVPRLHLEAVDWVLAEALSARGYVEAHYDELGRRFEPVVRHVPFTSESGELPISKGDVLVVTGGGKGITAECALALAKESRARLALIGRSRPESDEELASNLRRVAGHGIELKYISADITNPLQVREALSIFESELGPIAGILHGAARNRPQLISSLDEDSFRQTLEPKIRGARNLLDAIDPARLKLLVTFGSIIARSGLQGEADYGVANEWLRDLTEEWQAQHPACRCLAVEWSVWSGTGMGERLGRSDRLLQHGITPISSDDGVATLLTLLRQPPGRASVIMMSRFLDLPAFKIERPELPFLRFLEQVKIFYPGVELVVDAELSTSTDPYLEDHLYEQERLLPAVIGLEAMAQVAMALMESDEVPDFEDVRFSQAVVVPDTRPLKLRIVALKRGPLLVELALQTDATDFQINHFQGKCRFADSASLALSSAPIKSSRVTLDPAQDLYGNILFQSGRFKRISNYRLLRAKECVAEIAAGASTEWFIRFLPQTLVLGNPGVRDSAIHSIQACIPQSTLLPLGVDRLSFYGKASSETLFAHAKEVSNVGNDFTYNLTVKDADGCVRELWEGLRLRAVNPTSIRAPWAESLLGPYLERSLAQLIPGVSISLTITRSTNGHRRERSNNAFRDLLGEETDVFRRPDGKPETIGKCEVSVSHTSDLTIAIASSGPVSCDIEQVTDRPTQAWQDLLGPTWYSLAEMLAEETGERISISATRTWATWECLKKIGVVATHTPSLLHSNADGWVMLKFQKNVISTYAASLQRDPGLVVLAVLAATDEAHYMKRSARASAHNVSVQ